MVQSLVALSGLNIPRQWDNEKEVLLKAYCLANIGLGNFIHIHRALGPHIRCL